MWSQGLCFDRITLIERWSTLEEVIRYLNSIEPDRKMAVLLEQVSVMGSVPVGQKVYTPDRHYGKSV